MVKSCNKKREFQYVLLEPLDVIFTSLIIHLPFLIVGEHFVGPVDLLEMLGCVLVAFVLVWMVLLRKSPECSLDLSFRGLRSQLQKIIEVLSVLLALNAFQEEDQRVHADPRDDKE